MRQTRFRTFSSEPIRLPASLLGGWVLLEADGLVGTAGELLVRVEIEHDEVGLETLALHPAGAGVFRVVFFVNRTVLTLQLHAYGALLQPQSVRVRAPRRISSADAARRVLLRRGAWQRLFHRPLPLAPAAWKRRVHDVEAATIADLSVSYAAWLAAFATWPSRGDDGSSPPVRLELLVFSTGPGPALDATLASVGDARATVVARHEDWQAVAARLDLPADGYVGLLGAGEVLIPHAVDVARALLGAKGLPAIALADEDRLGHDGRRGSPAFKPEPNHALMLSGTLSHGLWLVRGDVVPFLPSGVDADGHAELARLALWLSVWRERGDPGKRLPVILSSRRLDAPLPLPARAAAIVDDHLSRAGLPLRALPTWPVRLRAQPVTPAKRVTALVPSTLRAPHSERCLQAILRETGGPGLDMIVAVAQPHPLDELQRAVALRLEASGARVVHFAEPSFNFSRTMNLAARETRASRLLLLNDDVSPLSPDWLATMCAFLADPRVGIVGARLCYPDRRLQHAGVIMGLAGLCEHAFRFEAADAPGYQWRAQLPQRLSAVTGACMLVDADIWRQVGGMDETYPSAFNDVDLCLRVDELGREIVLSDALLVHHELQTYGSHFAGARAAFEKIEIARMRARWADRVADDPFYSPNLSLIPEYAWTPTLPPRL